MLSAGCCWSCGCFVNIRWPGLVMIFAVMPSLTWGHDSQVGASPVVKTTERLTGQVWQMGSSRHCYAEEVPGITTVEEVQTGQARLDKQLWNWTYRTRVSLGQTV
ncbi:TPA: hypothetical protein ACH3X2_008511 [Trebouxia sp. C0005]